MTEKPFIQIAKESVLECLVKQARLMKPEFPMDEDRRKAQYEAFMDVRTLFHVAECFGGWLKRIGTHDCNSKIGGLHHDYGNMLRGENRLETNEHHLQIFLKSAFATAAHLEIEKGEFLLEISQDSLKHFLSKYANAGKIRPSADINAPLDEFEFLVVYQLMKNATYVGNSKLAVKIMSNVDYKIISVNDDGFGFPHEKGVFLQHLLENEIPDGESGHGLGLYLACLLAKQRSGFVEVQTRRKNEDKTATYSSERGIIDRVTSDLGKLPEDYKTGTCFSVYVKPK